MEQANKYIKNIINTQRTFFNNIYKLSSDKQFCQADKIIRFAAQLYTE